MKNIFFYETILGKVGIADDGEAITNLCLDGETGPKEAQLNETGLIKEAAAQLEEYLRGKRKSFDLPIKTEGTEFQQLIWNILRTIPYGETRSYKDVAVLAGNPKASRAVGMANNRNPISVFIPCHRVIGANGKLIGYAGGIEIKHKLLNLEKNTME